MVGGGWWIGGWWVEAAVVVMAVAGRVLVLMDNRHPTTHGRSCANRRLLGRQLDYGRVLGKAQCGESVLQVLDLI